MVHLITVGISCWLLFLQVETKSIRSVETFDDDCNGCNGNNCNSCGTNKVFCSVGCTDECVTTCKNKCTSTTCNRNCEKNCCQESTCVNKCTNNCQNNCKCSCTNNCQSNCKCSCTNNCQSNCSDQNNCKCSCPNNCPNCPDQNNCPNRCPNGNNDNTVVVIDDKPQDINVNNHNEHLVNLTTQIQINNVIHNNNNITVPVYLNVTNVNNIDVSDGGGKDTVPIKPYPHGCCHEVPYTTCYSHHEHGNACYHSRTTHCTQDCTGPISPVVIIVQQSVCKSRWPYYHHCSKPIAHDCSACFTCDGSYNPTFCKHQHGCSSFCRDEAPSCDESSRHDGNNMFCGTSKLVY